MKAVERKEKSMARQITEHTCPKEGKSVLKDRVCRIRYHAHIIILRDSMKNRKIKVKGLS
jgi:hypothetical protein